jgi:hypothetical protein
MALARRTGLSRSSDRGDPHAVLAARLQHRAAQRDRLADLRCHWQYCPMANGAEEAGVAPGE